MNVLTSVKTLPYTFSILYFSEFSFTVDQHHLVLYHHRKANPPITKKPTGYRPPDFPTSLDHRLFYGCKVQSCQVILYISGSPIGFQKSVVFYTEPRFSSLISRHQSESCLSSVSHLLPQSFTIRGFSGDHQQNINVLIYRCCVFTHVCCWLFSVGNKVTTTSTCSDTKNNF